MELYTDVKKCEVVNGALSPCMFCSLLSADEFADEFTNEFVRNLSPNSFQIVIYEHFCVCVDICWFTCMPVSIFIRVSAYFQFVVST